MGASEEREIVLEAVGPLLAASTTTLQCAIRHLTLVTAVLPIANGHRDGRADELQPCGVETSLLHLEALEPGNDMVARVLAGGVLGHDFMQ